MLLFQEIRTFSARANQQVVLGIEDDPPVKKNTSLTDMFPSTYHCLSDETHCKTSGSLWGYPGASCKVQNFKSVSERFSLHPPMRDHATSQKRSNVWPHSAGGKRGSDPHQEDRPEGRFELLSRTRVRLNICNSAGNPQGMCVQTYHTFLSVEV